MSSSGIFLRWILYWSNILCLNVGVLLSNAQIIVSGLRSSASFRIILVKPRTAFVIIPEEVVIVSGRAKNALYAILLESISTIFSFFNQIPLHSGLDRIIFKGFLNILVQEQSKDGEFLDFFIKLFNFSIIHYFHYAINIKIIFYIITLTKRFDIRQ